MTNAGTQTRFKYLESLGPNSKILLLVNPVAGRRKWLRPRQISRAKKELEYAGVAVEIQEIGEAREGSDLAREAVEQGVDLIIVGTAGAAASSATVGLVAWALRGGFLLTGLMAQLPAWQSVDPLLIMQGLSSAPQTETLEELMERRQQEMARAQTG